MTTARIPTVARMLRDIVTPDGFDREVGEVQYSMSGNGPTFPTLTFKSDDVKIEIVFTPQRSPHRRDGFELASGHVSFNTSAGWRSFDRIGVEDSFYIDNPLKWDSDKDPIAQANETIREFIEERIPESRSRIDRSESVPGIPFMVTPESKAEISRKLKDGGVHSFMPSGFGVGYVLQPKQNRWNKRAAPETEKFFGIKPLYVDTFDAD